MSLAWFNTDIKSIFELKSSTLPPQQHRRRKMSKNGEKMSENVKKKKGYFPLYEQGKRSEIRKIISSGSCSSKIFIITKKFQSWILQRKSAYFQTFSTFFHIWWRGRAWEIQFENAFYVSLKPSRRRTHLWREEVLSNFQRKIRSFVMLDKSYWDTLYDNEKGRYCEIHPQSQSKPLHTIAFWYRHLKS